MIEPEQLPPLLAPEQLADQLNRDDILLVDLSSPKHHAAFRLPGAVHLDYGQIVAARPPVAGLLPETAYLERLFSGLGIGPETHVIALDDEGGGNACRLLWTLDCLGHRQHSLLDGGLIAWVKEGFPLASQATEPVAALFKARPDDRPSTDAEWIMAALDQAAHQLIDARSPEEYCGIKRFSERAGHIPGAINWDWIEAMDPARNLRLKSRDALLESLAKRGIEIQNQLTTYCQTHHRSSLVYYVLKLLGCSEVKGYPGSWSDWGNRHDTPVEV